MASLAVGGLGKMLVTWRQCEENNNRIYMTVDNFRGTIFVV